jgi:uncharacterized glyoxalase superfamily protein PhnB
MQAIVPYLTVKGAGAASAFYQKAFDAKENGRHLAEDGKRFMHIALTIRGGDVFLCDEFRNMAARRRQPRSAPRRCRSPFSSRSRPTWMPSMRRR